MSNPQIERSEKHIQITEGPRTFRAIPTGIKADRPSTLTLLASLKEHTGWLVGEQGCEEWHFSGFTRREGQVYVYGPEVQGRDLGEILLLTAPDALPYLLRLVRALMVLQDRDAALFPLLADAVIFTDDGKVLFLPSDFMMKIKDMRSPAYRVGAFEIINHPYQKGEPRVCFSVGALLYRLLTGEFPFSDTTEEGIRSKIRNLSVIPPHLVKPEIRAPVSAEILQALNKPDGFSLSRWEKNLAGWERDGMIREITAQERDEIASRARTQKSKAAKSLRRKVFLETHGRTVAIVALSVIVTGAVLGSILANVFAPRSTAGFSSEQVVEAFYSSINALDHATMEDAVVKKAGKQEINEVTAIFVLDRQTQAYEGISYRVPADVWDAEGRPDLSPPYYVHGIADLTIKMIEEGDNPVYQVTYEKWGRGETDVESAAAVPGYEGYAVTDRVHMERLRKYWVIVRIDRLKTEPLSS